MSAETNRIEVRWTAVLPDRSKPDAGFPLITGAEHHLIYKATPALGTYNHGPKVARHDEWFCVFWYSHAKDEDSPGQRILYSRSEDGRDWSSAAPLFDSLSPMRPLGKKGVRLSPGSFHDVESRLYASASAGRIYAWKDHARGEQVEEGDLKKFNESVCEPLPRLMRRINRGQPEGPPFWVADRSPEGLDSVRPYRDCDKRVRQDVAEILRREKDANLGPLPQPAEKARLCEPVHYALPDGKEVRLFRDDLWSSWMFASVRNSRSESWPPAVKTNIPDSPSLSCVGKLPDGQVFLIGNRVRQRRDPLVIALSRDGFEFDRAWAIRSGEFPISYEGAHKGPGFQYPHAIVIGNMMWVAYSIGKEDIGITSFPVPG